MPGWVAEWFKAHAWKVCVRQKRTVGSNPTPSASRRNALQALRRRVSLDDGSERVPERCLFGACVFWSELSMTLILTCLTTDFVLQASDRRLTFADGPSRGKIKDDGRTKAVVLANAAAFAYTGLAEVGPEARTDYWLLDVLTAAPTIVEVYQEVYQNFLAGATSEF